MKEPALKTRPANQSRNNGFTLVELLVTITIIIVLAALSMVGIQRIRFSAAKAGAINQMRQVGTAVITWGAEKNNGEAFYVANGSGDYCDESEAGPTALAPGNPAKLLYNTQDPDQGYVTDHTLFYSGLVNTPAPTRKLYNPAQATVGKTWSTFVWYYPFATVKTARQSSGSGQNLGSVKVSPSLDGKLMMMTDYSRGKPKWEKAYMALFADGTVRALSRGEEPTRPD